MKTSTTFYGWLRQERRTEVRWDWPHLKYLYRRLDRVTSGKCTRLMVFMPPRHAKSETVTIRYAAWRLIRDPRLNIILGSYNQKLANRFSRRIRRLAETAVELAKDRRGDAEWETAAGGGVRAVGVGAGITGFGGSLVIIDDPVRSRADAESRALRDKCGEWFSDDIYTRLEPEAAVILIQTRWHEDDLAGRLERASGEDGDQWEIVRLSALAEDGDPLGRPSGEALWPERFSTERLMKTRTQLGSYSFAALYQQRPAPRDGELFRREWFGRIVGNAPPGLAWARGYDLAVSTRTNADHTASFRCAFAPDGTLYIADGFRRRIEYPEQRRYVIARLEAERDTVHGVEQALHGQALVQDIRADPRIRGRPLRSVRVDQDKWTRAHSWAPLAEAGRLVLVEGSWIDDFIEEACAFPNGRHDDQIDAVSLAVSLLRQRKRAGHAF